MASKVKPYVTEKVEKVIMDLRRAGKIDPDRVAKIDSFIRVARGNASVRLRQHVKKGGSEFKPVKSENDEAYSHCMFTEFYCDEMNKLTIAAGLRCE